ncbi:MAG: M23 family metallopeptidase [Elusimicrobia bacterium]|nr:M23 family metallopeptidase [Elusimicrobiota bacterium]
MILFGLGREKYLRILSGLLGAVLVGALLLPRGPAAQGDSIEEASALAQEEFERYVRQAALLKKNIDRAHYDRRAMMRVLRNAGVLEAGGPAIPSPFGGPSVFRPFQVKVYKGLWRWPLRAGIVSSEFKRRWGRRHEGIDIAADRGVPVLASAGGQVLYAGKGLKGYGNVVIVRHDQRTTTLYAHNDRLLVRSGERVSAGQIIAMLGSSGRSTGPHVHFEIRRGGRPVNPRELLVRSRF